METESSQTENPTTESFSPAKASTKYIVAFGAIVLISSFAWGPKLYRQVSSQISVKLRIEQIVFEEDGSSNLSHRVNSNLLLKASGLVAGDEILKVDLAKVEELLLAVPWIESVQIQKRLPSTILVRYVVNRGRALALRKSKLWLVTPGGRWIAADASVDLPVLTADVAWDSQMRWLEQLEAIPQLKVEEIKPINGASQLKVILGTQIGSQFGKATLLAPIEPSLEHVTRLKRVVQYLFKNNILVSTVDLRFGKKVVVNVGKRP